MNSIQKYAGYHPHPEGDAFPCYSLKETDISDITRVFDQPRSKESDRTDEGRPLRCRICRTIITSTAARIQVRGEHRHIFKNPAGYAFEIGCFSAASGCQTAGEPTGEFTWFPGHLWSYALCRECHTHIGWRYESGESGFFGLILLNLIEEK